jgi:hypothetical protein
LTVVGGRRHVQREEANLDHSQAPVPGPLYIPKRYDDY